MKKRLLSALLVLVMILTMLPVMAFADELPEAQESSDFTNVEETVNNNEDSSEDGEVVEDTDVEDEDNSDAEEDGEQEKTLALTVVAAGAQSVKLVVNGKTLTLEEDAANEGTFYLYDASIENAEKLVIEFADGTVEITGNELAAAISSKSFTYTAVEPEPTDPDPDPTKPDPTDPDPTDPDPTDPDPTDPDPTDPDPTKPDPTDPDPTKPDPTDPDPTKPDPATVEYIVEYYVEHWDSKAGKLVYDVERVTKTAKAGATVYAKDVAATYAHHHWNKEHKDSVLSGTAAEGKVVLKLYYDLNRYTVTYTDGVRGVTVFKDQTYTVPYGAPTPAFDNKGDKLGLLFLGWSPKVAKRVTGDVTYVAQWLDLCWDVSNVKKPTTPMNFSDVSKGDWFYSDVKYVYENGLMEGTSDTKFSPNSTLTRGMVATILWRMDGAPKTRYNGMFRDVDNYKWYTDGVEWAAAKGIVEGFEDGNFRPNDYVTREQLATMLYRYAQYKKCGTAAREDLADYKDGGDTHAYAVTAVRWSLANDLLGANGGKIQPRADATRAEVAAAVATFCQNIMK